MEDQKLGQKPMEKEVIEYMNDSLDKMTKMIERMEKKFQFKNKKLNSWITIEEHWLEIKETKTTPNQRNNF
ncbi:MAG: hypothetical protein WCF03_11910 [Nitrososphaeraceae archaeon]